MKPLSEASPGLLVIQIQIQAVCTPIFSCQRKMESRFEPSYCPNLLFIIIKRISLVVGFDGVCLYMKEGVKIDPHNLLQKHLKCM